MPKQPKNFKKAIGKKVLELAKAYCNFIPELDNDEDLYNVLKKIPKDPFEHWLEQELVFEEDNTKDTFYFILSKRKRFEYFRLEKEMVRKSLDSNNGGIITERMVKELANKLEVDLLEMPIVSFRFNGNEIIKGKKDEPTTKKLRERSTKTSAKATKTSKSRGRKSKNS